ncbi:hypothetical protein JW314_01735 [Enterobacter roggenkampii]|uniref:hypothetical protein n=1 Tax=Enterobacter roggenkampii TaxID=1812935 RepID=UPI001C5B8A46|nr:hypothetical protein [Enterobacter roggenkampii]MBW4218685.1 hypothetical protein [Enterobacter roggenkampii]
MTCWDSISGKWQHPEAIWNINETFPDDFPDCWLSRPGGSHFLGMSFHFSPYTFAIDGEGDYGSDIHYYPSDFYLNRSHDPYNSWGVSAIKKEKSKTDVMTFWDHLPGVIVYDKTALFTLPDKRLSSLAGTEATDNDFRIFHGLFDNESRDKLVSKYLEAINSITGPRFAGWPFGNNQLINSVFVWINSANHNIDAMLQVRSIQHGERYTWLDDKLYDPGNHLGSWDIAPATWECRNVIKAIYKSKLLLEDGFHEIALTSAISAVERTFFEIVLFKEHGNISTAQNKIKSKTFMNRAKLLLPSYGYILPTPMINNLKSAYSDRNAIAHTIAPQPYEKIAEHISKLVKIIEWYYKNVI